MTVHVPSSMPGSWYFTVGDSDLWRCGQTVCRGCIYSVSRFDREAIETEHSFIITLISYFVYGRDASGKIVAGSEKTTGSSGRICNGGWVGVGGMEWGWEGGVYT